MTNFLAEEFRKILNKIDEVSDNPLNENQMQKVWAYNSGHGERLPEITKDPERHRDAEVVQLRMNQRGAPELVVTLDGSQYHADWNAQYGWVVDFD